MRNSLEVYRIRNYCPIFIIGDLHLTTKVQDRYRWAFFDWLIDQIISNTDGLRNLPCLYIVGDLTQNKDNHDSCLVNKIVDYLYKLSNICQRIVVLRGNHDYIRADMPFFRFLSKIPKIVFVNQPLELYMGEIVELFLPHAEDFFQSYSHINLYNKYKHVYLHQSFNGAITQNGFSLSSSCDISKLGMLSNREATLTQIYAGDIHVRQNMTSFFKYVGAPYPIYFGDSFQGGATLLIPYKNKYKESNLIFPTLKKKVVVISRIEDLQQVDLCVGDQIKVEIQLEEQCAYTHHKIRSSVREYCKDNEIQLSSMSVVILSKDRERLSIKNPQPEFFDNNQENILLDYSKTKNLSSEFVDTALRYIR